MQYSDTTTYNVNIYFEHHGEGFIRPPVCGEDGAEDVRAAGPDELGWVESVHVLQEPLHPAPLPWIGGEHSRARRQGSSLDTPLGVGLLLLLVLGLGEHDHGKPSMADRDQGDGLSHRGTRQAFSGSSLKVDMTK